MKPSTNLGDLSAATGVFPKTVPVTKNGFEIGTATIQADGTCTMTIKSRQVANEINIKFTS